MDNNIVVNKDDKINLIITIKLDGWKDDYRF
jgi:hypothetical protein